MFKITFNGVDQPKFLKVRAVSFTATPTLLNTYKEIPGANGKICTGTTLGEKMFSVSVFFEKEVNKSLTETTRELANWLKGDNFKPSKLVFSDDKNVHYFAQVSSAPSIDDLLLLGETVIEFIVPSGKSVGATKTVTGNQNANISIPYNGTTTSFPVIEFTSANNTAIVELRILESVTGKTLRIKGSFKQGEKITIDCNKKIIKRGNTVDLDLLEFTSDWLRFDNKRTYNLQGNINGSYKVTYIENFN